MRVHSTQQSKMAPRHRFLFVPSAMQVTIRTHPCWTTNVFPDIAASTFPEAAVFEICTTRKPQDPLHHTRLFVALLTQTVMAMKVRVWCRRILGLPSGANLEHSCFREGRGCNVWKYICCPIMGEFESSLASPMAQTGNDVWVPFLTAMYYGPALHSCGITTVLRCFVSAWECPITLGVQSLMFYTSMYKSYPLLFE